MHWIYTIIFSSHQWISSSICRQQLLKALCLDCLQLSITFVSFCLLWSSAITSWPCLYTFTCIQWDHIVLQLQTGISYEDQSWVHKMLSFKKKLPTFSFCDKLLNYFQGDPCHACLRAGSGALHLVSNCIYLQNKNKVNKEYRVNILRPQDI